MNSNTIRKKRTATRSVSAKPKSSRMPNTRSRIRTERESADNLSSPETEPINVMDDTENSVQEVVDLTCEGAENVVDLTNNDSILLVEESPHSRNTVTSQSYVLSSDDDEDSPASSQATTSRSLVDISCPICLDSYSEIKRSGRLFVSSKCGHLFCSLCLKDALKLSHTCPTCRRPLTHRQYHPLYI